MARVPVAPEIARPVVIMDNRDTSSSSEEETGYSTADVVHELRRLRASLIAADLAEDIFDDYQTILDENEQ